jgi:hypothetical protein
MRRSVNVRPCIPVSVLVLALGGCATQPAGPPLAGFYASSPTQFASNGSYIVTRELNLTLFSDGSFVTWFQDHLNGAIIRSSGLAAYDFQTNARGTWRFAGGRLFLRAVGPSNIVTQWAMGAKASFPTEEDQAAAVYRDGHWAITWKQTEYVFRKDVPKQSPLPTPANDTPTDGIPFASPPSTGGICRS